MHAGLHANAIGDTHLRDTHFGGEVFDNQVVDFCMRAKRSHLETYDINAKTKAACRPGARPNSRHLREVPPSARGGRDTLHNNSNTSEQITKTLHNLEIHTCFTNPLYRQSQHIVSFCYSFVVVIAAGAGRDVKDDAAPMISTQRKPRLHGVDCRYPIFNTCSHVLSKFAPNDHVCNRSKKIQASRPPQFIEILTVSEMFVWS